MCGRMGVNDVGGLKRTQVMKHKTGLKTLALTFHGLHCTVRTYDQSVR